MQILQKPFEILEVFIRTQKTELSMSDLIKSSGLSAGIVQRTVPVLLKKGYLTQRKKRGEYSLGSQFYQFCRMLSEKPVIKNIAHSYLQEIAQLSGEASFLAFFQGTDILYTDVVRSTEEQTLIVNMHANSRSQSLHSTAIGKILLAYMTEKEIDHYYDGVKLIRYTENTITNLLKLKKQLIKVKQEEIALNLEEHDIGISGIASPIKDWNGKVIGGICLILPSVRTTPDRLRELKALVKNCSLEISQALGYKADDAIIASHQKNIHYNI